MSVDDYYDGPEVNLPKHVKIAGYNYRVISEIGKRHERCADDPAAMTPRTQMIWIDSKQSPDGQVSALFHEILEAINYHYQLGLKHNILSTLETALYQVLKDNQFIDFGGTDVKRKPKKGTNRKNSLQKLGNKNKRRRR